MSDRRCPKIVSADINSPNVDVEEDIVFYYTVCSDMDAYPSQAGVNDVAHNNAVGGYEVKSVTKIVGKVISSDIVIIPAY